MQLRNGGSMKVVAFNGSPKKEGNTYHALKLVAEVLEENGVEVEIIHVGNKVIRGCMGCGTCYKNHDMKCIYNQDEVNEWVMKMNEADGILLGSPVHYAAVAGTMKSFLDRAFYVAGANNGMLRGKVGASVVAVRRSGGLPAFTQLNNFLNYSEMILPTSNYWNVIHGAAPGEVLQDAEGVQIMQILGENMARLLKMNAQTQVALPERKQKVRTNFIRKM